MITDKENEWRVEFRKYWFEGSEWHHNTQTALSIERNSEPYNLELKGYLQACRARQAELEKARELIIDLAVLASQFEQLRERAEEFLKKEGE
jgi:hypothetical protein